jgi:glycosyltransferase involved in cell wall biosynthesis
MRSMFHAGRTADGQTADRRPIHVWAPAFGSFGGGIGGYSRELVHALSSAAVQPSALQLFGKHDTASDWNGLPLRGSGRIHPRLRSAHFAALIATAGIWGGRRLIVSTHVNFAPVAHWIRRVFGTRYVVAAHGIDVNPDLSPTVQRALRTADAVWAVSEWTRQRLLRLGCANSRIRIVPNTVSGKRFRPDAPDAPDALTSSLRDRYRLRPDQRVVLTVARLDGAEGYKGYDQVMRALPGVMRRVGPVRYLVVGSGDDARRLRKLAAELGLSDCLTLCGFVPEEELAAHYRLADVFAMPSRGEGFGIVFLEAMASGVPVLSGNLDGSVDALAGGALGLVVNPDDIAAVANGLGDLLLQKGPAFWFEPLALRAECLRRFGHEQFRALVAAQVAAVLGAAAATDTMGAS